jgi:hypothetical protein
MSRDASVTFDWADGTFTFRLGIGQIRELQEKCDAGPSVVLRRLAEDAWFVDDLIHTIRLGLIGGGATPAEALKLVRRYVEQRPLEESRSPATIILGAALYGAGDEEPLGKAAAEMETAPPPFQGENSASPNSTPAAP